MCLYVRVIFRFVNIDACFKQAFRTILDYLVARVIIDYTRKPDHS